MNCKSCQVKMQSCSSHVYINITLANRDECVHLFNFLGWFTCWPTCTLGHWTFTSINPIGLLVCDQVVMKPVQHKQARTDSINQLNEDPNTRLPICSGLWFSLRGWHDVLSGYRKTHSLALRNIASECHFPWFLYVWVLEKNTAWEPQPSNLPHFAATSI